MKKDIRNIKLVEIPIISGSQGNKKLNRCHLSTRGKSVGIVHTIGMGIPFSNKDGFQPSNPRGLTFTVSNQWLSSLQVNGPSPKHHCQSKHPSPLSYHYANQGEQGLQKPC